MNQQEKSTPAVLLPFIYRTNDMSTTTTNSTKTTTTTTMTTNSNISDRKIDLTLNNDEKRSMRTTNVNDDRLYQRDREKGEREDDGKRTYIKTHTCTNEQSNCRRHIDNTMANYSSSSPSYLFNSKNQMIPSRYYEPSYPSIHQYCPLPVRRIRSLDTTDYEILQDEIIETIYFDHYPTLMERWSDDSMPKIRRENDLIIEDYVEFEEIEPTVTEDISYEISYSGDRIQSVREIYHTRSESRNFRKLKKRRIKRQRKATFQTGETFPLINNRIQTYNTDFISDHIEITCDQSLLCNNDERKSTTRIKTENESINNLFNEADKQRETISSQSTSTITNHERNNQQPMSIPLENNTEYEKNVQNSSDLSVNSIGQISELTQIMNSIVTDELHLDRCTPPTANQQSLVDYVEPTDTKKSTSDLTKIYYELYEQRSIQSVLDDNVQTEQKQDISDVNLNNYTTQSDASLFSINSNLPAKEYQPVSDRMVNNVKNLTEYAEQKQITNQITIAELNFRYSVLFDHIDGLTKFLIDSSSAFQSSNIDQQSENAKINSINIKRTDVNIDQQTPIKDEGENKTSATIGYPWYSTQCKVASNESDCLSNSQQISITNNTETKSSTHLHQLNQNAEPVTSEFTSKKKHKKKKNDINTENEKQHSVLDTIVNTVANVKEAHEQSPNNNIQTLSSTVIEENTSDNGHSDNTKKNKKGTVIFDVSEPASHENLSGKQSSILNTIVNAVSNVKDIVSSFDSHDEKAEQHHLEIKTDQSSSNDGQSLSLAAIDNNMQTTESIILHQNSTEDILSNTGSVDTNTENELSSKNEVQLLSSRATEENISDNSQSTVKKKNKKKKKGTAIFDELEPTSDQKSGDDLSTALLKTVETILPSEIEPNATSVNTNAENEKQSSILNTIVNTTSTIKDAISSFSSRDETNEQSPNNGNQTLSSTVIEESISDNSHSVIKKKTKKKKKGTAIFDELEPISHENSSENILSNTESVDINAENEKQSSILNTIVNATSTIKDAISSFSSRDETHEQSPNNDTQTLSSTVTEENILDNSNSDNKKKNKKTKKDNKEMPSQQKIIPSNMSSAISNLIPHDVSASSQQLQVINDDYPWYSSYYSIIDAEEKLAQLANKQSSSLSSSSSSSTINNNNVQVLQHLEQTSSSTSSISTSEPVTIQDDSTESASNKKQKSKKKDNKEVIVINTPESPSPTPVMDDAVKCASENSSISTALFDTQSTGELQVVNDGYPWYSIHFEIIDAEVKLAQLTAQQLASSITVNEQIGIETREEYDDDDDFQVVKHRKRIPSSTSHEKNKSSTTTAIPSTISSDIDLEPVILHGNPTVLVPVSTTTPTTNESVTKKKHKKKKKTSEEIILFDASEPISIQKSSNKSFTEVPRTNEKISSSEIEITQTELPSKDEQKNSALDITVNTVSNISDAISSFNSDDSELMQFNQEHHPKITSEENLNNEIEALSSTDVKQANNTIETEENDDDDFQVVKHRKRIPSSTSHEKNKSSTTTAIPSTISSDIDLEPVILHGNPTVLVPVSTTAPTSSESTTKKKHKKKKKTSEEIILFDASEPILSEKSNDNIDQNIQHIPDSLDKEFASATIDLTLSTDIQQTKDTIKEEENNDDDFQLVKHRKPILSSTSIEKNNTTIGNVDKKVVSQDIDLEPVVLHDSPASNQSVNKKKHKKKKKDDQETILFDAPEPISTEKSTDNSIIELPVINDQQNPIRSINSHDEISMSSHSVQSNEVQSLSSPAIEESAVDGSQSVTKKKNKKKKKEKIQSDVLESPSHENILQSAAFSTNPENEKQPSVLDTTVNKITHLRSHNESSENSTIAQSNEHHSEISSDDIQTDTINSSQTNSKKKKKKDNRETIPFGIQESSLTQALAEKQVKQSISSNSPSHTTHYKVSESESDRVFGSEKLSSEQLQVIGDDYPWYFSHYTIVDAETNFARISATDNVTHRTTSDTSSSSILKTNEQIAEENDNDGFQVVKHRTRIPSSTTYETNKILPTTLNQHVLSPDIDLQPVILHGSPTVLVPSSTTTSTRSGSVVKKKHKKKKKTSEEIILFDAPELILSQKSIDNSSAELPDTKVTANISSQDDISNAEVQSSSTTIMETNTVDSSQSIHKKKKKKRIVSDVFEPTSSQKPSETILLPGDSSKTTENENKHRVLNSHDSDLTQSNQEHHSKITSEENLNNEIQSLSSTDHKETKDTIETAENDDDDFQVVKHRKRIPSSTSHEKNKSSATTAIPSTISSDIDLEPVILHGNPTVLVPVSTTTPTTNESVTKKKHKKKKKTSEEIILFDAPEPISIQKSSNKSFTEVPRTNEKISSSKIEITQTELPSKDEQQKNALDITVNTVSNINGAISSFNSDVSNFTQSNQETHPKIKSEEDDDDFQVVKHRKRIPSSTMHEKNKSSTTSIIPSTISSDIDLQPVILYGSPTVLVPVSSTTSTSSESTTKKKHKKKKKTSEEIILFDAPEPMLSEKSNDNIVQNIQHIADSLDKEFASATIDLTSSSDIKQTKNAAKEEENDNDDFRVVKHHKRISSSKSHEKNNISIISVDKKVVSQNIDLEPVVLHDSPTSNQSVNKKKKKKDDQKIVRSHANSMKSVDSNIKTQDEITTSSELLQSTQSSQVINHDSGQSQSSEKKKQQQKKTDSSDVQEPKLKISSLLIRPNTQSKKEEEEEDNEGFCLVHYNKRILSIPRTDRTPPVTPVSRDIPIIDIAQSISNVPKQRSVPANKKTNKQASQKQETDSTSNINDTTQIQQDVLVQLTPKTSPKEEEEEEKDHEDDDDNEGFRVVTYRKRITSAPRYTNTPSSSSSSPVKRNRFEHIHSRRQGATSSSVPRSTTFHKSNAKVVQSISTPTNETLTTQTKIKKNQSNIECNNWPTISNSYTTQTSDQSQSSPSPNMNNKLSVFLPEFICEQIDRSPKKKHRLKMLNKDLEAKSLLTNEFDDDEEFIIQSSNQPAQQTTDDILSHSFHVWLQQSQTLSQPKPNNITNCIQNIIIQPVRTTDDDEDDNNNNNNSLNVSKKVHVRHAYSINHPDSNRIRTPPWLIAQSNDSSSDRNQNDNSPHNKSTKSTDSQRQQQPPSTHNNNGHQMNFDDWAHFLERKQSYYIGSDDPTSLECFFTQPIDDETLLSDSIPIQQSLPIHYQRYGDFLSNNTDTFTKEYLGNQFKPSRFFQNSRRQQFNNSDDDDEVLISHSMSGLSRRLRP